MHLVGFSLCIMLWCTDPWTSSCYPVFKMDLYEVVLSCKPSHFKVYRCCFSTQHHSMKFSLFWDVIQCRLVVSFWRFRTTYRFQLQASSSPRRMTVLHDPWRWDQYIVPKCQYLTTNIRCITFQKSKDVIYIMAEAWKHTTPHTKPHSILILPPHLCLCLPTDLFPSGFLKKI